MPSRQDAGGPCRREEGPERARCRREGEDGRTAEEGRRAGGPPGPPRPSAGSGGSPPRIGLVLGAGGIAGASYITGVLEGLRRLTGFGPEDSTLIVGTSAGSFIGGLVRAGLPIHLLHYACTGDMPEGWTADDEVLRLADELERHNEGGFLRRFPPRAGIFRRPLLACPRAVWRGLAAEGGPALELVLTGLLGEGPFSTGSITEIVRSAWPRGGWPDGDLWVTACDLESAERVVFGRADAPLADLHVAVSASAAVPGLFAPVRIGGRRYADGGALSANHLDLVAGLGLDLVVCVSPLAGAPGAGETAGAGLAARWVRRLDARIRARVDLRVDEERRVVEETGTQVLLFRPTVAERAVFSINPTNLAVRASVARSAADSTVEKMMGDLGARTALRLLSRAARAGGGRRRPAGGGGGPRAREGKDQLGG